VPKPIQDRYPTPLEMLWIDIITYDYEAFTATQKQKFSVSTVYNKFLKDVENELESDVEDDYEFQEGDDYDVR